MAGQLTYSGLFVAYGGLNQSFGGSLTSAVSSVNHPQKQSTVPSADDICASWVVMGEETP